jgi:hypothetical protein
MATVRISQLPVLPNSMGTDILPVVRAGVTSSESVAQIIALAQSTINAYSVQTPVTAFSITIANGINSLILNPAGTLATGTIIMPAAPVDGQIENVSTTQTITALTVSANAGQTILNTPTTLAEGTSFSYQYNLSTTTWFRIS